jgi:hypothetical protein
LPVLGVSAATTEPQAQQDGCHRAQRQADGQREDKGEGVPPDRHVAGRPAEPKPAGQPSPCATTTRAAATPPTTWMSLRVHALRYPGQRRGRPGGRTAVQSASLLWEPWPWSWSARAGVGEYAARRSGRRVRPATRPPRWLLGCGLSCGPEASDPLRRRCSRRPAGGGVWASPAWLRRLAP